MHHRLFVATEDVTEVLVVLMQCLAQSANVAVPEYPEAATEEGPGIPVSFRGLGDEEPDQGLGGGQFYARLPCHCFLPGQSR
jgi:hypothetical protein